MLNYRRLKVFKCRF